MCASGRVPPGSPTPAAPRAPRLSASACPQRSPPPPPPTAPREDSPRSGPAIARPRTRPPRPAARSAAMPTSTVLLARSAGSAGFRRSIGRRPSRASRRSQRALTPLKPNQTDQPKASDANSITFGGERPSTARAPPALPPRSQLTTGSDRRGRPGLSPGLSSTCLSYIHALSAGSLSY